jgi:aminopeptidase N
MSDTPRTDAVVATLNKSTFKLDATDCGKLHLLAVQLERELAEVTAAIHKVHPTRRGSLVDMVEDLESYRETAMNAFRLSEKELAAERALADRLAEWLEDIEGRCSDMSITLHPDADAKGCVDDCWEWSERALAAWKEARRGTD